jgi:hypothetical protein
MHNQGSVGSGVWTGRTTTCRPLRRSLPASSSAAPRDANVASGPWEPCTWTRKLRTRPAVAFLASLTTPTYVRSAPNQRCESPSHCHERPSRRARAGSPESGRLPGPDARVIREGRCPWDRDPARPHVGCLSACASPSSSPGRARSRESPSPRGHPRRPPLNRPPRLRRGAWRAARRQPARQPPPAPPKRS